MHWRMGVPHSDAAFGLPVIQVSVMPCHDDFLSGGDEEPYLQAVSRGCRADPIPVREPLCRVPCIARRLFRGERSGSAQRTTGVQPYGGRWRCNGLARGPSVALCVG
jgi:hypothetical protein